MGIFKRAARMQHEDISIMCIIYFIGIDTVLTTGITSSTFRFLVFLRGEKRERQTSHPHLSKNKQKLIPCASCHHQYHTSARVGAARLQHICLLVLHFDLDPLVQLDRARQPLDGHAGVLRARAEEEEARW